MSELMIAYNKGFEDGKASVLSVPVARNKAMAEIPDDVIEKVEHCKDCCCARSWKALGISDYTGKSIPEHIAELKDMIETAALTIESAEKAFGNDC